MDEYLIWSHEQGRWWAPGARGYTTSMTEAGRYDRATALRICTDAILGTSARLGALPDLPVRLSDLEAMRDAFEAKFPGYAPRCGWL